MKKILITLLVLLTILTGCKRKEIGPVTTTEEVSDYNLQLEDLGLSFDFVGACTIETTSEKDEIQKIVVRSNNEDWLGLVIVEYLTYEEGQTFESIVEALVSEHDSYSYTESDNSIYYAYNTIFENAHYLVLSNIYELEGKYAILSKYIPSTEINIKPSKKYIYIPYFAYQNEACCLMFDDAPEIYKDYFQMIYSDGQNIGPVYFAGFQIGASSFSDYIDNKIASNDETNNAKVVEINGITTLYTTIIHSQEKLEYVEYAFSDSKAIHMYFIDPLKDNSYIVTFDAMFKSLHEEKDPEITNEEDIEETENNDGEEIETIQEEVIEEEIDNYNETDYDKYLNDYIYNQENISYDQVIDKIDKNKTPVYVNPCYWEEINNEESSKEIETYGWTTTYTLLDKKTYDDLYTVYSSVQNISHLEYTYAVDFFKSVVDLKDENVIYKKNGLFDKDLQYIVFVRDDDTYKHISYYYVCQETSGDYTYKTLRSEGNYYLKDIDDITINKDKIIGTIDENKTPFYIFIPNDEKGSSYTEGWTTDYLELSKEDYKTCIDKINNIEGFYKLSYKEIIKEIFDGDTSGTIYNKKGEPLVIIFACDKNTHYYIQFSEDQTVSSRGGSMISN